MSSDKDTLNLVDFGFNLLVQILSPFLLISQFLFLATGFFAISYQEYELAIDFLTLSLFPVIFTISNFILVRTPIYKKMKANQ